MEGAAREGSYRAHKFSPSRPSYVHFSKFPSRTLRVPIGRRTAQQPVRLIDTRMGRRVSTQAYSPEIALPWSLFRNYHPSPAPTAPTPATPPRSVVSCFGFESPTVPERAHVTNPHLLQEPYRSVAPSLNLNTYSDSGSPIIIPRTPPPAWQCLSPRPPTYGSYDSSDEDALMSSSSGHRFGL